MTVASRLAAVSIVGLAALQVAWHAWLAPATAADPAWVTAFFVAPIAPAFVLLLLRHRRAGFWGAVAAIVYFCHGVMNAWAAADVRWLALVQALLSALLIVAASWDGMRARFAKRRAAPPAV